MINSMIKFRMSFTHIVIGTVLALTILLSVIIMGYLSLNETQKNTQWVNHTLQVISTIQRIQGDVNELGVSQRGYILTSQDRHASIFNSVIPQLEDHLNELQSSVIDNPKQLVRYQHLKSRIEDLRANYLLNIKDVRAGKPQLAVGRIKTGTGQNIYDDIKMILNDMNQEEEYLLKNRLEGQKIASDQTNAIIFSGSVTSFLMVLLAALLIALEFKRRNEIQDTLNRTGQIQKAILDSAAFSLIASDKDGNITLFNPAAERLLGYTAEEVMAKSQNIFHVKEEIERMAQILSERFHEDVRPGFEVFTNRAQKGILEDDQWTYVRKNGSRVPVSLSVTAQRDLDNEITGYLGIAYDITQRLNYEKTIIKAKEQALAGTQAKSEFLANMSHEIRTPMNAIMGMAELLNESDLDDEQRKYVDVFQRAGESLLNLINDILDLSKIEAGHFELDRTPFKLSSMIEKSSEIMALKAHQKHLELAVDMDDELHDHYFGDPNRLRQVLINLLGNAIKFTKRGEVLLRVMPGSNNSIEQEIIFEIQDTGIGMSEDHLQNLFERFNQADSSITKEYGGTGLGLNITKRLVELMNGRIQVQSTIGVGTKFTVTIKLEKDEAPEDETPVVKLAGKRVLIVDDTRINRFIMKKILDNQGAITEEATDGERALEMINGQVQSKTPYDLILLDCRMPGIDGFNVAETILRSEAPPLIMMLTSDNRPGDLARSRAMGLKSYLVKPVLRNELLHEIGKTMIQVEKAVAVPAETAPLAGGELNILLVDDNDENRLVIRSFLKKLPWKVEEARNGNEALALYSPNKYDIILMDMQMPVLDGYSATREIRRMEKENSSAPVPVIALTAYALKEEVDKSLEAGCDGHLSKPVSKAQLLKGIADHTQTIEVKVEKDLEDLIPDYLKNREEEVSNLLRAFERNDFVFIQAIGHKLRGSAGSYGFDDLSLIGKELEEKSKVKDTTNIKHALGQYQHYLRRLKVSYA